MYYIYFLILTILSNWINIFEKLQNGKFVNFISRQILKEKILNIEFLCINIYILE